MEIGYWRGAPSSCEKSGRQSIVGSVECARFVYPVRLVPSALHSNHATVKEDSVRFGKLKFLASVLALALALTACTPSPETVGDLTRTSIQEVFRGDPRFKDTGIEVMQVKLSASGERQYQGVASVKYAGTTHEVPVKVLLDGMSIKWSTAPDAFSFVPDKAPAPAQ